MSTEIALDIEWWKEMLKNIERFMINILCIYYA